jgi:hypothetical protein
VRDGCGCLLMFVGLGILLCFSQVLDLIRYAIDVFAR